MLVANYGHEAKLHNVPERTSSNVGAARVIAEIFRKFFFTAVWSCKTRLNGYPGRGEPPNPDSYIMFWIEGF